MAGPDLLGRMIFHDALRPEAAKTLEKLESVGLRTVMLTGDRRDVAEQIARGVGIAEIRAGLLPEEKVEAIQELKEHGARKVAMIGDGVNDAPCIAAADFRGRHGRERFRRCARTSRSRSDERSARELRSGANSQRPLAPHHL